jgi:hypothetical protein
LESNAHLLTCQCCDCKRKRNWPNNRTERNRGSWRDFRCIRENKCIRHEESKWGMLRWHFFRWKHCLDTSARFCQFEIVEEVCAINGIVIFKLDKRYPVESQHSSNGP